MGRIGYEQHYGISFYSTPIEEVVPLIPEQYHKPIMSRVAEVDMWLGHYGYKRSDHLNTQNASFLPNLRYLVSGLRTACFRFLKGQYVHSEDWSCLIDDELAIDILDAKYHPMQIAGLPESESKAHPDHGRKLTNIHTVGDITVAVEWDYLGEWPNYWIAFYPEIQEGALSSIAPTREEAIENVKEGISRFKVNRIDSLYFRYSRKQLEKKCNRSLRTLAMVRGVSKFKTMRICSLISAIVDVHEQPSFEYPLKRAQIIHNELSKARKRFDMHNGLFGLKTEMTGQCLLPGFISQMKIGAVV